MWPYWLMFLLPAFTALAQPTRPWVSPPSRRVIDLRGHWIWIVLLWAIVVGLRHKVGGDWITYVEQFDDVAGENLRDALDQGEPAYWLVTWAIATLGLDYHITNLVFGSIFSLGLVVFCRAQPRPWLALAVSVPYMVIVLGMGYTRQGVALGLSMIGLVALARDKRLAFVLWVAAGALFHKSAVILVPLGMLTSPRKKLWSAFWVGCAALALYFTILKDSVEAYTTNYIDAQYQSEGALVRVLMNVVPAAFLLIFRKRFRWLNASERNLWILLAVLAFVASGWLAVSPSSTAVDRVALYLIPLQLFVFSRLPDVLSRTPREKRNWVGAVLLYYGAVQFVWLFFAVNSRFWLPYQLYPFAGLY